MTEDQKDRIRAAARELADALTDVGCRFDVSARAWGMATIDGGISDKYVYEINVTATNVERIV